MSCVTRQQAKSFNFSVVYGAPRDVAIARTRPSKRVKRSWRKAGKPCSLRQWARAMTPWSRDAREWLAGPASVYFRGRGKDAARPPSKNQRINGDGPRSRVLIKTEIALSLIGEPITFTTYIGDITATIIGRK